MIVRFCLHVQKDSHFSLVYFNVSLHSVTKVLFTVNFSSKLRSIQLAFALFTSQTLLLHTQRFQPEHSQFRTWTQRLAVQIFQFEEFCANHNFLEFIWICYIFYNDDCSISQTATVVGICWGDLKLFENTVLYWGLT